MPFDAPNLPRGDFAEDPAGPPSTTREVWDTALKAQIDVANIQSRWKVLDDEYDKAIVRAEKATGVRLFHPRRDRPTEADYLEAEGDMDRAWTGVAPRADDGQAMDAAERRFHRELDKLREAYPDKAAELGPDTVWEAAYARVRHAEQASAEATRRSPLTADLPLLGEVNPVAMAASFWGFLHDPVNIATSVIGPNGSAARGILWNASRQAAAGAVQQAAMEPFVQSWRREAGLDFGWGQAAQNVAFAGLFGGAVDAGGRSLNRTLRGRPLSGVPANDVAPSSVHAPGAVSAPEGATIDVATSARAPAPDLDAALEAGARRLPEDDLVRRAADGEAAATIELAEKLGPHSDDPAAVRGALDQYRIETLQAEGVADALAEASGLDAAAVRLAGDLDTRLERAVEHVAAPEHNPPVATGPLVPEHAFDDPISGEIMSGVDVDDVVAMWTYVREMRSAKAPQSLTQFLIASGGIADGGGDVRHLIGAAKQRPGLVSGKGLTLDHATLLAWEQGFLGRGSRPSINALLDAIDNDVRGNRVFRESDAGIADDLRIAREMEAELDQLGLATAKTVDAVRAYFSRQGRAGPQGGAEVAIQALRDGSLEPLAAASLLRERPELAGEVPPTTDTARAIHALARLSEPAFARVADGSLPAELAAIVAEAASPARHADLIERLAEARPRDATEARQQLAQMLQRPTDGDAAALLLGASDAHKASARAPGAQSAPGGARTRAPEFDEPVGEGARTQVQSLRSAAERQANIEDLKAALRSADRAAQLLDRARATRAFNPGFSLRNIWDPQMRTPGWIAAEPFDLDRVVVAGRSEQDVPLRRVFTVQDTVSVAEVKEKLGNAASDDGRPPSVFKWGDDYFVNDGNHRITAARAKGEGSIRAEVIELAAKPDSAPAARAGSADAATQPVGAQKADQGALSTAERARLGDIRAAMPDPRPRLADGGGLGDTAYSPTFVAAERAIIEDLQAQAVRTLPPTVRVEIEKRIQIGDYELDGYWDRRNNVLAVALDSGNPGFAFNHERIHALRAHGLFTAAEWRLLVDAANARGMRQEMGREMLGQYREQLTPAMVMDVLVDRGVPSARQAHWPDLQALLVKHKLLDLDDVQGSLERNGLWDEARLQAKIDEETVAFLAERYRRGEQVPGRVAALMQRMSDFLDRVRSVLAGHGFNTLDDVFRRIESGEVAMRTPREVTLPGGAKVQGIHLRGASEADMASAQFAIRAFHGTPHDFERFSLDKIGTGEGAQAYGHGLYFAERLGVAEFYRDEISVRVDGRAFDEYDPVHQAALAVFDSGGRDAAIRSVEEQISKISAIYDGGYRQRMMRALTVLKSDQSLPTIAPGSLYEVRLAAEPDDFLDWDKAFVEQPDRVREAARKVAAGVWSEDGLLKRQGRTLEEAMGEFGHRLMAKDEASVAKLREAGIPGIRYLDQGSRSAAEGTHNYVVFDDSLIEITHKNGEPVSPPWVREIGDVLAAADADGDAAQLMQACKLF